jgi:NACHT domain
LMALQKVKTIWNTERPLAIKSFYFPATIKIENRSQQINSLDELPENHVIFSGTAGQGKSIFLRWLIDKEIKSARRIPVFVELRRVPKGQFWSYIVQAFSDLFALQKDEELFTHFAQAGKVSLLLDAFDEVDPELVSEAVDVIERLAKLFPLSRIAVTSRPQSDLESSGHFTTYSIAPLSPDDLSGFFSKILAKDTALIKKLNAAVRVSPTIRTLISTPLLATLLTIVYRAHNTIPLDFADFYEHLFSILLVRHDKSKGGYERARKSGLVDRDMEAVFGAFCFFGRKAGKSILTKTEARIFAKNAAEMVGVDCKEDAFIDDIIKVTCLLQYENDRYQFIHQSVQEYFCSSFIRSRTQAQAERFYEQLLQKSKWKQWTEEIKFLEKIDAYRASKYFFIPSIDTLLSETCNGQKDEALRQHLIQTVANKKAVIQKTQDPNGRRHSAPKYYLRTIGDTNNYLFTVYEDRMYPVLFELRNFSSSWKNAFDQTTHDQMKTYTQIVDIAGKRALLEDVLIGTTKFLQDEFSRHTKTVQLVDSTDKYITL